MKHSNLPPGVTNRMLEEQLEESCQEEYDPPCPRCGHASSDHRAVVITTPEDNYEQVICPSTRTKEVQMEFSASAYRVLAEEGEFYKPWFNAMADLYAALDSVANGEAAEGYTLFEQVETLKLRFDGAWLKLTQVAVELTNEGGF